MLNVNLPILEEIENSKKYENQIQYPVFDDNNNINKEPYGEPAPSVDNDLPTEEEIYGYKKKINNA